MMNQKELMIAIENGLRNLWELSPSAVDYYNDIVYDRSDALIADRCTEELLQEIEDTVMQFIREDS